VGFGQLARNADCQSTEFVIVLPRTALSGFLAHIIGRRAKLDMRQSNLIQFALT